MSFIEADPPQISIEARRNQMELETANLLLTILPSWPGGSGASSGYTHTQVAPSVTWVINHTLPINPNVTIVDVAGAKFEPDAVNYSLGTVVVTFNTAVVGKAYLS